MPEHKSPHDGFFKQLFGRPSVARDFVRNYLPQKLTVLLDLDSLEVVEGSFVDDDLREYLSDLVFRVRLQRGGAAFIYLLFEHKSEVDRWVAWQVLRYVMRIWEKERDQRIKKLTPVVPIVFYHGSAAWRIGTGFGELVDFGTFDELREYVPDFDYHLCDLSRYTDDEIVGEPTLRFGLSHSSTSFDGVSW